MSLIATVEQLETIYGHPGEASTVKIAGRITPSYRLLIEKSPRSPLQDRRGWTARRAATCLALCAFMTRQH